MSTHPTPVPLAFSDVNTDATATSSTGQDIIDQQAANIEFGNTLGAGRTSGSGGGGSGGVGGSLIDALAGALAIGGVATAFIGKGSNKSVALGSLLTRSAYPLININRNRRDARDSVQAQTNIDRTRTDALALATAEAEIHQQLLKKVEKDFPGQPGLLNLTRKDTSDFVKKNQVASDKASALVFHARSLFSPTLDPLGGTDIPTTPPGQAGPLDANVVPGAAGAEFGVDPSIGDLTVPGLVEVVPPEAQFFNDEFAAEEDRVASTEALHLTEEADRDKADTIEFIQAGQIQDVAWRRRALLASGYHADQVEARSDASIEAIDDDIFSRFQQNTSGQRMFESEYPHLVQPTDPVTGVATGVVTGQDTTPPLFTLTLDEIAALPLSRRVALGQQAKQYIKEQNFRQFAGGSGSGANLKSFSIGDDGRLSAKYEPTPIERLAHDDFAESVELAEADGVPFDPIAAALRATSKYGLPPDTLDSSLQTFFSNTVSLAHEGLSAQQEDILNPGDRLDGGQLQLRAVHLVSELYGAGVVPHLAQFTEDISRPAAELLPYLSKTPGWTNNQVLLARDDLAKFTLGTAGAKTRQQVEAESRREQGRSSIQRTPEQLEEIAGLETALGQVNSVTRAIEVLGNHTKTDRLLTQAAEIDAAIHETSSPEHEAIGILNDFLTMSVVFEKSLGGTTGVQTEQDAADFKKVRPGVTDSYAQQMRRTRVLRSKVVNRLNAVKGVGRGDPGYLTLGQSMEIFPHIPGERYTFSQKLIDSAKVPRDGDLGTGSVADPLPETGSAADPLQGF